jgi:hypothetical protein
MSLAGASFATYLSSDQPTRISTTPTRYLFSLDFELLLAVCDPVQICLKKVFENLPRELSPAFR